MVVMNVKKWLKILSEKSKEKQGEDVGRWSSEFPNIIKEVEKEP